MSPKGKSTTLLASGKIRICFPYSAALTAKVSALSGRFFDKESGNWECDPSKDNLRRLLELGFPIPDIGVSFEKKAAIKGKAIKDLKKTLRPFQEDGVAFFKARNGRILLGDEQGLGKSIQTIAYLHDTPDTLPAMIICPASVKENWRREILSTSDRLVPKILEGTTPYRLKPKANSVYIINYDILSSWFCVKGTDGKFHASEDFASYGFKTAICDEGHRLKNSKTNRTKAAGIISRRVPHFSILSGTPMPNRPIELFSQIQLIDPAMFPSMMKYAQRYCKARHRPWGWDFNGSSNTRELHEKLSESIMLRRLKRDVLQELPPKVNTVIPLDITNRQEYDRIRTETIDWVKRVGAERAVKAKKSEAIVRYEMLKQAVIRGKFEPACEWVEDFIEGGCSKLVAFGWHRNVVKSLHERFKDFSVCPLVMGSKQACADRFTNEEGIRLFVGNLISEGEGLNLQVASNVAKIEILSSPGIHAQATDRCHRIGQAESVNVWWLAAKDTIDEVILQKMDSRRLTISGILNGEEVPDDDLLYDILTSL